MQAVDFTIYAFVVFNLYFKQLLTRNSDPSHFVFILFAIETHGMVSLLHFTVNDISTSVNYTDNIDSEKSVTKE